MAGFYAARSRTIPPLPWSSFPPPFSGSIVGALIVGFVRALSVHFFPEFEVFVVYLVMAAILSVRPHGLFAQKEGRKI